MNRPGITAITIENFKGISDPVRVPLRPLTLLFGANSAGKSTIIQAMHYALELLQNRNPDPDRTLLGGETIDLGGFESLVHKHELDRRIRLRFDLALDDDGLEPFVPEDMDEDERRSANVHTYLDVRDVFVELTVAWHDDQPRILWYTIGIDSVMVGSIAFRYPSRQSNHEIEWNLEHPFFRQVASPDEGDSDDAPSYVLDVCTRDGIVLTRLHNTPSEYTKDFDSYDEHTEVYVRNNESVIPTWGRQIDFEVFELTGRDFHDWPLISQIFVRPGELLLRELQQLRYLGPIRTIPPRSYRPPKTPDPARWATGLAAWDGLMEDAKKEDRQLRSRGNALRNPKGELLSKCNDYLGGVLGIAYQVQIDRLTPVDRELGVQLATLAARFDEWTEEDVRKTIYQKFQELLRTYLLTLLDTNNDTVVEPQDVGVGVYQVIPVVVGAIDPDCTIYAVEQPELHIHPAVQVELADVFLRELFEPNKKPRLFLLETHSEHLVLRIMRRIRETFENALPPNFPDVTPEDVAVLHVDAAEGNCRVIEIPLNTDGEFERAWPHGFFGERAEELM